MLPLRRSNEGHSVWRDVIHYWPMAYSAASTIQNFGSITTDNANDALLPLNCINVTASSAMFGSGQGWAFNGTNAYFLNVVTSTSINFTTAGVTKDRWFIGAAYQRNTTGSTVALIGVMAPAAGNSAFGLSHNADGSFGVYSDGPAGAGAAFTLTSAASYPSSGHLLLTKNFYTANSWTLDLYFNGVYRETLRHTSAVTFSNANSIYFAVGASNHISGLGYFNGRISNVVVGSTATTALTQAFARNLYAELVRPWDEEALIRSRNQVTRSRLIVTDSAGTENDLSSLMGQNWVLNADVSRTCDNPKATAKFTIRRRSGVLADMSPLNDDTAINESTATNLVTRSQEFNLWTTSIAGTGVAPVVTANTIKAPDGTYTADQIVFNTGAGTTFNDASQLYMNASSIPTVIGRQYTMSIWLKGSVGGEKVVLWNAEGAAGNFAQVQLTTEWQRYTYTRYAAGTGQLFVFGVRQGAPNTINATATVHAWGAQFEEGPTATAYIPTTTTGATRNFRALLDFRRYVRFETAIVPTGWNLQGWEWKPRFEGYIDSWSIEDDTVTIDCQDKSAPLDDHFIMDGKAYNFYTTNKLAETFVQQLIDENTPKLFTATGTATVGYLGGGPILYTDGGTAACPTYTNSNWLLRYSDSQSGPVLQQLQGVANQIGFDVRYRWNEAWQQDRLEFTAPPRNRTLTATYLREDSDGYTKITFNKPHGLQVGQGLSVQGAAAYSTASATVREVTSYYTVKIDQQPAGTPAVATAASVYFGPAWVFKPEDVRDVSRLSSAIADIRNHVIVKYARQNSTATFYTAATAVAGTGNLVEVQVINPADATDLSAIDPDGLGISFSLSGTGISALNKNFRGTISGRGRVVSDTGISFSANAATALFASEYVRFKQVTSTYTPSVQTYGLRQAGVYEGGSTNLDTTTEAQALADNILSDLCYPQADISIRLPYIPHLQLHDVIALDPDGKGRWSDQLVGSITALKEHHAAGECYLEIDLRGSAPTLGKAWAKRLLNDRIRPTLPGNNLLPTDTLRTGISIDTLGGRQINVQIPREFRDKRGLRHDYTEVHITDALGTQPGANFSTFAGATRGNNIELRRDGSGNALIPGTKYNVWFRQRDVLGNFTPFTSATTVAVRHTGSSLYAKASLTASSIGITTGKGQRFFPFIGSISSPSFQSYSCFTGWVGATSALFFITPVTGVYRVTAQACVTSPAANSGWLRVSAATAGLLLEGPYAVQANPHTAMISGTFRLDANDALYPTYEIFSTASNYYFNGSTQGALTWFDVQLVEEAP